MGIYNISMLESCVRAGFIIVFNIKFKNNKLSLFLFFFLIFIFIFIFSYIVIIATKYDKIHDICHILFTFINILLYNIKKNIEGLEISNIIVV